MAIGGMTRLVPTLDEQHDVGVRFWQLLDEGIEQWVREKGAGSRRLRRRRQRHDASIPGQSDSSRVRLSILDAVSCVQLGIQLCIQLGIELHILACPGRGMHAMYWPS